jgi:hypothetical protein
MRSQILKLLHNEKCAVSGSEYTRLRRKVDAFICPNMSLILKCVCSCFAISWPD